MEQVEKGLISGKEALIALANGDTVEVTSSSIEDWHELNGNSPVSLLLTGKNIKGFDFKFRIKPKTILLNGIEIPVPFEPEEGDEVWFIDCDSNRGYSSDVIGQGCKEHWIQFGAWKSEDEIKQVVAALLKVFKG